MIFYHLYYQQDLHSHFLDRSHISLKNYFLLGENNDQPIDKSRKPSSTSKSPELSNVVKYTVPEPIEGLSSLCKKEFSRNPNEFFVSSLKDSQKKPSAANIISPLSPRDQDSSYSEIILSGINNNQYQALSNQVSPRSDSMSANQQSKVGTANIKKTVRVSSLSRPSLGHKLQASDTEESSFFDEDEVLSEHRKIPKSGTIGTAIGSIVGASNTSSSANNSSLSLSPQHQRPRPKAPTEANANSFVTIGAELFDPDTSQLNKSQLLLKTKENELEQVKEMLGEMRQKNGALSSAKQNAEFKLQEQELQTKMLASICGERERELAEKERLIHELHQDKLKALNSSGVASSGEPNMVNPGLVYDLINPFCNRLIILILILIIKNFYF